MSNTTYMAIAAMAASAAVPAYAGKLKYETQFKQAVVTHGAADVKVVGGNCISTRVLDKKGIEFLLNDTDKNGKADTFTVYNNGKQIYKAKKPSKVHKLCHYASKQTEKDMGMDDFRASVR